MIFVMRRTLNLPRFDGHFVKRYSAYKGVEYGKKETHIYAGV